MKLFTLFNKKTPAKMASYDINNETPVIRCSICTGEKVAGFKNIHTGKFTDIMLIRDEYDIEMFKQQYGIKNISTEY